MRIFRVCVVAFVALLAIGGVLPRPAAANGDQLLAPTRGEPPVLYYFGLVRDERGRPLGDVSFTVAVKNLGLVFTFETDYPGHFRSPDIGAAIRAQGETINADEIIIDCIKDGYKRLRPVSLKVPRKNAGPVEIDFVLAPE